MHVLLEDFRGFLRIPSQDSNWHAQTISNRRPIEYKNNLRNFVENSWCCLDLSMKIRENCHDKLRAIISRDFF